MDNEFIKILEEEIDLLRKENSDVERAKAIANLGKVFVESKKLDIQVEEDVLKDLIKEIELKQKDE